MLRRLLVPIFLVVSCSSVGASGARPCGQPERRSALQPSPPRLAQTQSPAPAVTPTSSPAAVTLASQALRAIAAG